jgi:tripartite ATP-independent transporter DctP family solute receptor
MADRVSRSRFVATAATSAFASIAIVRSPARAAQFDYKLAHGTPTNMSVHVRLTEMWDAVKTETKGALNIKIFPNSELGSELAQLSQLRSGALQFMIIQGVSLSGVVPGVAMDGLGFAYNSAAQWESAYDGPLGVYLRKLIIDKNIFAFPRVFNFGMREVTASSHPIRSAADFAGFKIRTPPAPISVDLFKTLGASPTPIVFPELYMSLQTKVVDGQETPYSTIDVSNFHEVQKYLSVTNHTATIFWFIGNMDAWNAIPPAMQATVLKHAETAAMLQRRDTAQQSVATADKLRRLGMTFNNADTASMRAPLKPFYGRWKTEFGATAWDLLEKTSGKLV